MKCNYLTIEREYGSGGTKIARRLAEESGLPCYGAEILESVSQSIHVPVEQIQKYEESVSNSFLYTLFMMSRADADKSDMLNREGHIYVAEQDEIRRLANQSRAIFLGHCASEALKERRGVVKVFIRAEEEDKKQRIMDNFIQAQAIAVDISALFAKDGKIAHPWDYYPELFKKEQKAYEEAEEARQWEEYMEKRRAYNAEWNYRHNH